MAARGEPTCWADVQDEEDRLANTPADLLEPLIPLPNSSSSQAFQNALEDPLGVAPAKSMDAALTRARAPDATFTAGSISLSSADFNPITFLAEVHRVRVLVIHPQVCVWVVPALLHHRCAVACRYRGTLVCCSLTTLTPPPVV